MWAPRLIPVASVLALVGLICQPLGAAEDKDEHGAFLKKVADELRVIQQARELYDKYAPRKRPTPEETLLTEERLKHRLRHLALPKAQSPEKAAEPPVAEADLVEAAQKFAEKERQREKGLQADRIRRLITSAKEHIRLGRWVTAGLALEAALRIDRTNTEAARLLKQVRIDEVQAEKLRTAKRANRETAAAWRAVNTSRVPFAATLTLPRDWAERSARAEAELAQVATDKEAAQRAAVKKALQKKISIDALEMSVSDMAAYFRQVGGVNIVVEKEAAPQMVTLELRDVTVESALDWVTKLTGLAHTIRNGCVHIGPPDKVKPEVVVRVYDVSDLLHVRQSLARGQKRHRQALDNNAILDPTEQDDVKSLDELAEELMDFLKAATGKKQWDDAQGDARMNVRLGRLVVNAEPTLHEKLLKVLENVRP